MNYIEKYFSFTLKENQNIRFILDKAVKSFMSNEIKRKSRYLELYEYTQIFKNHKVYSYRVIYKLNSYTCKNVQLIEVDFCSCPSTDEIILYIRALNGTLDTQMDLIEVYVEAFKSFVDYEVNNEK